MNKASLESAIKYYLEGKLDEGVAKELLVELHVKYKGNYGAKMEERCPNEKCGRPLVYTFNWGPACPAIQSDDLKERSCGRIPKYSRF